MSESLVAIVSQLQAIKHSAEAALALLGFEEEAPQTVTDPANCAHPEEKRRGAAVMGHSNQFFCLACNTLVEGG